VPFPMTPNVQPQAQPAKESPEPQKECMLVSVFNFVTSLVNAVSLFFLLVSIFGAYVSTSSYGSYSTYYYSYFSVDSGALAFAFIFAFAAFGLGIATFVITLAKRQRGERLFTGISKLVFGVLLLVLTLFAMAQ